MFGTQKRFSIVLSSYTVAIAVCAMLKIIHSMQVLRFSSLMAVYEQSNQEYGRENYPALSPAEQLLQAEQDFYDYLRDDFFREPQAFCALWELQGCCVSALRIMQYRDGFLLSGLETAPEARGKGCAKSLLKEVLSYMENCTNGVLYSHVKKNNIASLAVHKACGFEKYSDVASYIDGSVCSDSVTLIYRI